MNPGSIVSLALLMCASVMSSLGCAHVPPTGREVHVILEDANEMGSNVGSGTGGAGAEALRFGMGLSSMRIAEPERRDRLLLVSAMACALVTLLGAAGESLGMERHLKANTAKTRTYSLWRQGCMYYQSLPMMPEALLRPLMERFAQLVCEQTTFRGAFGLI